MIVELLTLGDELLDGRRVDTNTAWLGRTLTSRGIPPRFRQTTTDRIQDISEAFRLALSRAQIIVATGGLGPTQDDLTFEGLAQALGQKLCHHPEIEAKIRERLAQKKLVYSESNTRQAWLPEKATPLPNPWGTAPGCMIKESQTLIFCLPGVPLEMQNMFEQSVIPEIEKQFPQISRRSEKIFSFVGISEAKVEEGILRCKLSDLDSGEFRIAYTASFPQIDVTLSLLPKDPEKESVLMKMAQERILLELGEFCVGIDQETLEAQVVRSLQEKNLTLGIAESFTGGLLAGKIVNVPGSSKVFPCGMIAYQDEFKKDWLGVQDETLSRYGAVSAECALEMALGIRKKGKTDLGVSTTGIAGPSGETPTKKVGLAYLAWVGEGFEEVKKYEFHFDRNRNRILAVFEALRYLLRWINQKK